MIFIIIIVKVIKIIIFMTVVKDPVVATIVAIAMPIAILAA